MSGSKSGGSGGGFSLLGGLLFVGLFVWFIADYQSFLEFVQVVGDRMVMFFSDMGDYVTRLAEEG